jgi:hypothetical protein
MFLSKQQNKTLLLFKKTYFCAEKQVFDKKNAKLKQG